MRTKLMTISIISLIPVFVLAQNMSDCLILQDIGMYKLDKPEAIFPGEPPIGGPRTYESPGIIGAVDHFPDHKDVTYQVMYIGGGRFPSPTVQVTQHAGADSDKWLPHEVDISFRNYYGIPSLTYDVETIAGNTILISSVAGYSYRWLSGNKVIVIAYTDLEMKKPQPMEVVQVYLTKHPSTLPPMTLMDLRSPETRPHGSRMKWNADYGCVINGLCGWNPIDQSLLLF